MPNYRRRLDDGGCYFLTLVTWRRRSDCLLPFMAELRVAWRKTMVDWPCTMIAGVVLPDHLHLVLQMPEGDNRYSDRVRVFKQRFTHSLPEKFKGQGRKRERKIWPPRFWEHTIRSEADLASHIDYVHFNPVKHGLVSHPDQWAHSTWHRCKSQLSDRDPVNHLSETIGE